MLYSEARPQIRTGDLLLYRPTRWNEPLNKRIARRGPLDKLEPWQRYAHAGMAVWCEDVLLQVDILQGVGGRCIRLSREVERFPGQYDVYHVLVTTIAREPLRIFPPARLMLELAGSRYGWESLAYAAASQYGLVPTIADDDLNGSVPHCSQAFSRAYRTIGCDPLKGLSDRCTTPNHLAVPSFSRYQLTLMEG